MIEEIKEALEKATPGLWMVKGNEVWTVKTDRDDYHTLIAKKSRHIGFENDLNIIANTPTYIRYLLDKLEKAKKPRTIDEWHEDYGPVLWWSFPIEEPPYCGTPLDTDWPEYHTHWTPIVEPTQIYEEASHE